MSETIEFEADARLGKGRPRKFVVVLDNIDGRHMLIDNAMAQRVKVALTPVDPEPAAFAPPWDDAPDWAEWAARDKNGAGKWFEMRPNPAGSPWWMAVGQRQAFGDWREAIRDPNWRETLQHRPEPPEPELNPCPRCGGEMRPNTHRSLKHWLVCDQCGGGSPCCNTRSEAIAAHNARKSPELDPCPYCGGEWRELLRPVSEVYFAQCDGCNFETPAYPTQWALAAAVNRRAP